MVKRFVHSRLMRHIDSRRVEAAIAAAEQRTSAPIHVTLAPHFWGELRNTAERAFDHLGLTATPERNGILFFVAPTRREFVVLGDVGIHERVGQEFWDHVAAAVSSRIKQGDLTAGLVHGIETVADELEQRFPKVAS
jgi:uncharacterized membrane protein